MDFSYDETQEQIRDLANRILADYCTQDQLRKIDDKGYYDNTLWQQLAASGLLGIALNEVNGGMGLDMESLCLLFEAAGKHAAPIPLIPVLAGAALPLQSLDDPSLTDHLNKIAEGSQIITHAPAVLKGSTLDAPKLKADYADGSWTVSGRIDNVPAAKNANFCWAMAQAGEDLIALLFSLEADGVTVESQVITTGEYTARISLDRAPARLLARNEKALSLQRIATCLTLTAQAAMATGLCDEMLSLASSYTSERQQFGQPIARFQAVSHRLVDAWIDSACLRAVTEQAACRLSAGKDTLDMDIVEQSAQVAKIWTADALHRISHTTQHVHGGTGVDRDYPLFRYALRARQLEIELGGASRHLQALGDALAHRNPQ